MFLKKLVGAATAFFMAFSIPASAAIVTVFDGIASGRATFDSTVTGAGGTVDNTVLSGLSSGTEVDAGDFTIKNNDGATVFFQNYGTLSGSAVGIDPVSTAGDFFGRGFRDAPLDYFDSGFTLTFDSPVNAVGFEVGDWATCCFDPLTELFISFDGGTPIKVASASSSSDGQFPSQSSGGSVFEIFVSAIDDTDTFSEVSFWGNGAGEFLVAGGDIRYSAIDIGSLPVDPNVIPLPAAAWMLLAGVGGLAAVGRRKKA